MPTLTAGPLAVTDAQVRPNQLGDSTVGAPVHDEVPTGVVSVREDGIGDRWHPSARNRAALLTGAWVSALAGGLLVTGWLVRHYVENEWLLADARAYWLTGQEGFEPYRLAAGQLGAYLYSPAFAQLVSVVTWLPWSGFAAIWLSLETAAFVWLLRPLGWRWGMVALLWCSPELALGNVFGFLGITTVLALSGSPAAWSVPILTKPTLAVGLVWHAIRREPRQVGIAIAATGSIVVVSFTIDPEEWKAWVSFLLESSGDAGGLLAVRILLALAVVSFAAQSRQAWLVPFGLVLATPTIGSISVLSLLAAVPRLASLGMGQEDVQCGGSQ